MSEIIVLTGPESCGKTTLATQLSEALRAPMVPEASRDYLNQRMSPEGHFQYSEPDLLEIAGEQYQGEQQGLAGEPDFLVCDTDLLVMIIWSEVRFGQCHSWILDTFARSIGEQKRHYLLCDYHIPWAPDPLRENPDNREELFQLYRQKLDHYQLDYTVMVGEAFERLESALALIEGKMTAH